MEKKPTQRTVFKTAAVICLLAAFAFYLLPIFIGNNIWFFPGILFAIGAFVAGKKAEVPAIFILGIILGLVISLELFMRIRDGFSGKGWYYLHLLRHPEDNIWN